MNSVGHPKSYMLCSIYLVLLLDNNWIVDFELCNIMLCGSQSACDIKESYSVSMDAW